MLIHLRGAGSRTGSKGHQALLAAVRLLVTASTSGGAALDSPAELGVAGQAAAEAAVGARAWLLEVLAQLGVCLAAGGRGSDADASLQQALVAATLHLAQGMVRAPLRARQRRHAPDAGSVFCLARVPMLPAVSDRNP